MPHFCADELIAILAVVPFLGAGVLWLRRKLRPKYVYVVHCATDNPAHIFFDEAKAAVFRDGDDRRTEHVITKVEVS